MRSEFRGAFSAQVVAISMVFAFLSIHAQAADPPAIVPPHGVVKPKPKPKAEAKLPEWINKKIAQWKASPAGKTRPHPPIYSYKYKGKQVYLFELGNMPQVYDAKGKMLGSPWGGVTGRGDGRLKDFRTAATSPLRWAK